MATTGQANIGANQSDTPQRLALTATNIKTAADFARFMASIMAALVSGDIDHKTADSICKTANMLLKAVEMQAKFGNTNRSGQKILALTEAEADVPNVTHVTSVTSQPAIAQTTQARKLNSGGGPWCTDHYVKHKQYIKATDEVDEDPLCLPCANQRRKENEES